MSYPKAMLSQLTDLDDSELDEQAGVFGYSNKRDAPPSPKLFFNPTSVFLDVPDYRETVSHSKRYTHQPSTPNLFQEENTEEDHERKQYFLQKSAPKGSERRLSIETMETKNNNGDNYAMYENKNKKTNKNKMENKAMNSNILSVKGSDSDSYLDSDEQEEYLYNKPIKYKYSNNTIKKKKNIEFHPELEYDKNLYYEQNAFISPDKSTKKKKKNYGSIIKDRKLSQHFQSFTDSEDETFIQIWNKNNNFKRRKRMMSDISLFSILVLISICSFFMAIYSMSTLPLVDVAIVNIKSVLAAENSLTFYIHVRGANWNLWSISVQQCTLGIYVTPKGNHTLDPQDNPSVIYLGDVHHVDEPLVYPGYYFWQKRGVPVTLSTTVRLLDPGKFGDDLNKTIAWADIIKDPFDLTVRGSFSYELLYQKELARVCAIQAVDPTKNGKDTTQLSPTISCIDDDDP